MSKICVTANTSIPIFASTCKQITQSEPTEFSKNGVFQRKCVVITFSNYLNLSPNHALHRAFFGMPVKLESWTMQLYDILGNYCRKYTYRNQNPGKFRATEILDI